MGGSIGQRSSSAKYEHASKFTLASQKVFSYILYERPNETLAKFDLVHIGGFLFTSLRVI